MAVPDGFWSDDLEGSTVRMNATLQQFDTAGNRPAASATTKGMRFIATDTGDESYDNGGTWIAITDDTGVGKTAQDFAFIRLFGH